jgi:hypothetical protein
MENLIKEIAKSKRERRPDFQPYKFIHVVRGNMCQLCDKDIHTIFGDTNLGDCSNPHLLAMDEATEYLGVILCVFCKYLENKRTIAEFLLPNAWSSGEQNEEINTKSPNCSGFTFHPDCITLLDLFGICKDHKLTLKK